MPVPVPPPVLALVLAPAAGLALALAPAAGLALMQAHGPCAALRARDVVV